MGWFKKRDDGGLDVDESIKDLKPGDIRAAVEGKAASDAKIAELEAQLVSANAKAGEVDAMKSQLAAIEARTAPPPPTPTGPVSVLEDEDRAFQDRQAPLAAVSFHGAAMAAKTQAMLSLSGRDLALFRKYSNELDASMQNVPPERRIHPQAWINALTYIKGVHFDEATTKGDDFFSETGGAPPPPNAPPAERLSDEEMNIARKMKIDPAKYLEQKKKIRVVNV